MTTAAADPTTTAGVPDEASRAEWHALSAASQKAYKRAEGERSMVALYMVDHLKAGGMAPAEYGLPSEAALVAYRRACERAEAVQAAEQEYTALRVAIETHPFQLHLDQLRADKAES